MMRVAMAMTVMLMTSTLQRVAKKDEGYGGWVGEWTEDVGWVGDLT